MDLSLLDVRFARSNKICSYNITVTRDILLILGKSRIIALSDAIRFSEAVALAHCANSIRGICVVCFIALFLWALLTLRILLILFISFCVSDLPLLFFVFFLANTILNTVFLLLLNLAVVSALQFFDCVVPVCCVFRRIIFGLCLLCAGKPAQIYQLTRRRPEKAARTLPLAWHLQQIVR